MISLVVVDHPSHRTYTTSQFSFSRHSSTGVTSEEPESSLKFDSSPHSAHFLVSISWEKDGSQCWGSTTSFGGGNQAQADCLIESACEVNYVRNCEMRCHPDWTFLDFKFKTIITRLFLLLLYSLSLWGNLFVLTWFFLPSIPHSAFLALPSSCPRNHKCSLPLLILVFSFLPPSLTLVSSSSTLLVSGPQESHFLSPYQSL